VAVAVEGKIPVEWFDEEYGREKELAAVLPPAGGGLLAAGLSAAATTVSRPTGRLVVVGHGGLFNGPALQPAQEKLLLHSANWLVNRADRLPSVPEKAWSFPRVALTDQEMTLWRGATGVLMPLAAVFLGLVAVMLRRVR
jgi:hypothetical protein